MPSCAIAFPSGRDLTARPELPITSILSVCQSALTRHHQALALIPTPRTAGYQPVINATAPEGFRNASTWGGQVMRHDDGVYHMWAAQMSNNCGIWAWGQNSEVWHATSSSPFGPFYAQGPAISPAEAHEPIVARAPTGEYVMWYTKRGTLACNRFCMMERLA